MNFKKMREYSHEEFVELVQRLSEEELLELVNKFGGTPVLYRMAFDERICHVPIIQTGSAIIIINSNNQILLQERMDNGRWGLPGGCQDLGEDLRDTAVREAYEETNIKLDRDSLILIDNISGNSRKRSYPNTDIVYNNTSLYLAQINDEQLKDMKWDSESKRLEFFDLDKLPENQHDEDLVDAYKKYLQINTKRHL